MKRNFTIIVLLCVMLCLTACLPEKGVKTTAEQAKRNFFAMSTDFSITAYSDNAEAALTAAEERVKELEKLWSATDSGSEIYKINHSSGQAVAISDETALLLSFALDMADRTGGALEPTIYPVLLAWGFTTGKNRIPDEDELQSLLKNVGYDKVNLSGNEVRIPAEMELDLGAVGKGYTGDILAGILKDAGITSALVNLGGNIQIIGTKPDGSDWRLGLRDPFGEGNVGAIEISDMAVVTSGNYERYFIGEDGREYGHIINPTTGYPVSNGLASVTIIAKEGKMCDALSTALFVMGADEAVNYWQQNKDFDMILITNDNEVYLTEGVKDKFNLSNSNKYACYVITDK